MKRKFNPTLLILFVGLAFVAISVFVFARNCSFKKNGVVATAVITDMVWISDGDSSSYDVYVSFTTSDGEEINGKLGEYESTFYKGKELQILYMPDNPHQFIYYRHTNLLPFIFLVLGSLAVAAVIVPLLSNGFGELKLKKLQKIGTVKTGKITKLDRSKNFYLNGKYLTEVAIFDDTGMLYEKKAFLSANEFKEGEEVTLYVNEEKENDFAFIKQDKEI